MKKITTKHIRELSNNPSLDKILKIIYTRAIEGGCGVTINGQFNKFFNDKIFIQLEELGYKIIKDKKSITIKWECV